MQYKLFRVKLICDTIVRQEEWIMPDDSIHVEKQVWYTVEIVNPDFEDLHDLWLRMDTWCTSNLGQGTAHQMWSSKGTAWDSNCRWLTNSRKFWFRDQEDQFMFMLRWEWERE